jgi:hypothetical protein
LPTTQDVFGGPILSTSQPSTTQNIVEPTIEPTLQPPSPPQDAPQGRLRTPTPTQEPLPGNQPTPIPTSFIQCPTGRSCDAFFTASTKSFQELPDIEDEVKAYLQFKREHKEPWPNQISLYDGKTLAFHETESEKDKEGFRKMVIQGNCKYQEPHTPIPRIYPTQKEWSRANPKFLELMEQACQLDVVLGATQSNEHFIVDPALFFSYADHKNFVV